MAEHYGVIGPIHVYRHWNPTHITLQALMDLINHGETVKPRGKEVKEIRPAIFAFTDPRNQVTFLRGRKINPFFQRAECLWILAGRADVEWLTYYNKNMKSFSDDGVYFNAPYGERLRYWNKNDASNFIFNPIDQLQSVFQTLKADPDSRQAVASIWNPLFDGFHYKGLDRPCNMLLTFKIRNKKLDVTVYNRSNDHCWGLVGANIAQFTTILLTMAAWLGVEPGTYYHISDSLHIYTDSYGYKEVEKIINAYGGIENFKEEREELDTTHFTFSDEPVPQMSFEEFEAFLNQYLNGVHQAIHSDDMIKTPEAFKDLLDVIATLKDDYFRDTLYIMTAYRAHRLGIPEHVFEAMRRVNDSQWKISCLYFLHGKYKDNEEFKGLYKHYPAEVVQYIEEG